MSEAERRQDSLEMKYVQYSSIENIAMIIRNLRREIEVYYPRLTPAQRIGHELAKDISSIVGYLHAAIREKEDAVDTINKTKESWTKYFKLGTKLDLTPFQVQAMIDKRQKQCEDMQIELHKLRRRIQRLRCESVKLYPDELEENGLI